MLLASNFERRIDSWTPLNLTTSVTAARVSDGTAYSGNAFYRVRTSAVGASVAHDLRTLRGIPGTNDFMADSHIAVLAWVRAAPRGPNVSGTLTIWQLNVDPANPANHPNTEFTVNTTWTLIAGSIDMLSTSYSMRVEFYLQSITNALDIDCVFVN
jgi:hypothetical protein